MCFFALCTIIPWHIQESISSRLIVMVSSISVNSGNYSKENILELGYIEYQPYKALLHSIHSLE